MNFTVESLEFYLLILIRISTFIMSAPFFNANTIPMRVKMSLSVMLTLVMIPVVPVITLDYVGVIGYASLILQEAAVGLILGFMCNICLYIVSFAGQLMDIEIGLSMANMFDPMTNISVTVTGNMYMYLVMLVMMATRMHHFVLRAILDTFSYFNIGQAVFRGDIVETAITFMGNYFLVGFRIVLPIFACMLVINVVLGVLSRAAPQMNMFVVGIQLKVFVGILILLIIVPTVSTVSNFIFDVMKETVTQIYNAFLPR
nr:flagellar biosynthetic protein FliR [Eubacterium sp.]